MKYKLIVEEGDKVKIFVELELEEVEEFILSDLLTEKGFSKKEKIWVKEVVAQIPEEQAVSNLREQIKLFQTELSKTDNKIFRQILDLRNEFRARIEVLEKEVSRITKVLKEKKLIPKDFDKLYSFPVLPEIDVAGFIKRILLYKVPVWLLIVAVVFAVFLTSVIEMKYMKTKEVVKEEIKVDSLAIKRADSLELELKKIEVEYQKLLSIFKDFRKKVVIYESIGGIVKRETLELYSEKITELSAKKQELENSIYRLTVQRDSLINLVKLMSKERKIEKVRSPLGWGVFLGSCLPVKKDYFGGIKIRVGTVVNVFGGLVYPQNRFFIGVGFEP